MTSNVNPHELAHFSKWASVWWDPKGPFSALHHINPLRLSWIERMVSLAGLSVLDVGCGGGILSEAMARQGAQVLGIDLSDQVLGVAQLHAWEEGLTKDLTYRHVSLEQLATELLRDRLSTMSFGAITCMEMLEHVPDPVAIVSTCARLLQPGGWLFLSTLNKNIRSFLGGIFAAEYVLELVPKGTHTWSQFIRPSTLAGYCQQAGLSVEHLQGLSYHPLKKHYFLTDDVSVNYLVAAQKI